jgi:hypothetical protein
VVKNGMTLKPMMSTIDEYPQMQAKEGWQKSTERGGEEAATTGKAVKTNPGTNSANNNGAAKSAKPVMSHQNKPLKADSPKNQATSLLQ